MLSDLLRIVSEIEYYRAIESEFRVLNANINGLILHMSLENPCFVLTSLLFSNTEQRF